MITFELAKIEDAEYFYRLRNDPTSLENSINKSSFSLESHIKWFESALQDKRLQLFLCKDDSGNIVGTARAEYTNDRYTLSWIVDPQMRGKGLGGKIVSQLVRDYSPSLAIIKKENASSIKIAEKAGMKLDKEENGVLFYLGD